MEQLIEKYSNLLVECNEEIQRLESPKEEELEFGSVIALSMQLAKLYARKTVYEQIIEDLTKSK